MVTIWTVYVGTLKKYIHLLLLSVASRSSRHKWLHYAALGLCDQYLTPNLKKKEKKLLFLKAFVTQTLDHLEKFCKYHMGIETALFRMSHIENFLLLMLFVLKMLNARTNRNTFMQKVYSFDNCLSFVIHYFIMKWLF